MKQKYLVILCACSALLTGSVAYAKDYIIALSPMQNAEALQQQTNAVIRFLVKNVEPGEQALIIDGLHLKVIATFRVQDKKIYNNPKAKIQLNRRAIAALKAFASRPVTIAEHQQAAVMQVPQLLKFLGRNYGKFTDTDIIIIGSPLYVDARDPGWSMTDNRYPGDGNFNAAAHASPFSLQGTGELLTNTRVHWAYPDNAWISSDEYRVMVTRVWHLLVEGYGSELSTFTGDLTTLWRRAAQGAKALPHGYKRQDTEKLENIRLIDRPKHEKQLSIYERELSHTPPAKQVIRQAQNVEIGISWNCEACDLDLYVRPHHGAEVLFYSHSQTKLGFYHKDFIRSPKTDGGFETVTLTSTVDLRNVLIAVNWFGGKSPKAVTGEIRLAIDNQTYGMPFSFSGGAGNGSRGKERTLETSKPANTNWLIISPYKIIGL